MALLNSALNGNTAQLEGGGIYSRSDFDEYGSAMAVVLNSTVTGNSAVQSGGGVYNEAGRMELRHCTITSSSAPAGAGAGVASDGNAYTQTWVQHSIVAGNIPSDVDQVGLSLINSFMSAGYHLIRNGEALDSFNQPGDLLNQQPMLATLSDNGGPTLTHRLLPGSPAIDTGTNGDIASLSYDQRGSGFPRRVGARVDIGAFEAQAPLSFRSIEMTPGGILLRIQGATSEALQIQWNTTPGPGGWNPLTSGITDGTGLLEYINTGVGALPQRFYRAVRP